MSENTTKIHVACPICKQIVPRESDTFPFCGERCQTRDLGNWASNAYAIADNNPDDVEALISELEAYEDTPRTIH